MPAALFLSITHAKDPTIRQSPLSIVSVCPANAYATITYQGIECKATTDTWANECDIPDNCCNSGEFLRIHPENGFICENFNENASSTHTTFCADCCSASEFAAITTLGLKCVGASCTSSDTCTGSTPGCNTDINRCVQCTSNNHCIGDAICNATFNKCVTCTWDAQYTCVDNSTVKYCRTDNGLIGKEERLACAPNETCSNGSCIAHTCDYSPACSPLSQTETSSSTSNCGATRVNTRTTACNGNCTAWNYGTWSGGTQCSAGQTCSNGSCVTLTCSSTCTCPVTRASWETSPAANTIACGTTWTASTCSAGTNSCGNTVPCTTAPTVSGTYCASGTCVSDTCCDYSPACSPPLTQTDTNNTDATNCGATRTGTRVTACPGGCGPWVYGSWSGGTTCSGATPYCNWGSCAQCAQHSHCSAGKICKAGSCANAPSGCPCSGSTTRTCNTSTTNCGGTQTKSACPSCTWGSCTGGTACSGATPYCSSGSCAQCASGLPLLRRTDLL